MRPVSLCLILLGALLLSGCTGTMLTRTSSPMPMAASGSYDSFGGYPFQAVVVDYRIEERSGNAGDNYTIFVSLAIDLVIDTVLSPVDLVAWAFGCRKRGMVE